MDIDLMELTRALNRLEKQLESIADSLIILVERLPESRPLPRKKRSRLKAVNG